MITFRETSEERVLDVMREGRCIGFFRFERGNEPRYCPSHNAVTSYLTLAEMQTLVDEYERRKPWRTP